MSKLQELFKLAIGQPGDEVSPEWWSLVQV